MSDEIFWLTLTAMLTLFQPVPYIIERVLRIGLITAMGYSKISGHGDSNQPSETTANWAKRAYRAHMNSVETLPIFATLIIAANLSGSVTPLVIQSAMFYFFTRIAHYLVYVIGIPIVRTVVFVASLVPLLIIAAQIIPLG